VVEGILCSFKEALNVLPEFATTAEFKSFDFLTGASLMISTVVAKQESSESSSTLLISLVVTISLSLATSSAFLF
jgi:hypothetical protein